MVKSLIFSLGVFFILLLSPLLSSAQETWYVLRDGNWNDPNTWTLDAGLAPIPNNPSSEIPNAGDDVIIRNGRTVTVQPTTLNIVIDAIRVDGVLNLTTSNGHNFTLIDGEGIIRISGNSGVDNFPAGVTTGLNGFGDDANGGTLIVEGTDDFAFTSPYTFRNVRVEKTDPTDLLSLARDLTINGDLTVRRGTVEFGEGGATANRTIDVFGDLVVENNGSTTDGRIVTDVADTRHELNLYGDFTNAGDVRFSQRTSQIVGSEATDGRVDVNFVSTTDDQTVNCNGPTYFYRIEINKGTPTYALSLQASNASNFVLTGPADYNTAGDVLTSGDNPNAFALISGTARVGSNITINPINNVNNYSIGTNARLWIDGGTVIKPTGGAAITPYGILEISSGLLEVYTGSGITTRENGLFRVSGGTTNIPQFRTSVFGAGQVGGYEQTGGTVNIGDFPGSASASNAYYTFSLTYEGNTFTMTGGTLNIEDPSDRGLIFINSDPSNIRVEGGTVNAFVDNNEGGWITSRAPFWNLTLRNTTGSTNANARFLVGTGTSGNGGDARTITDPDLRVLNDLIVETGTTRGSAPNVYGTYLDLCPGGIPCADLEVGGDLTLNDSGVIDFFSSDPNDAGSSTLTFNRSGNATFYIGDITTYEASLTGYDDPDNDQSYVDYRFPIYNLIVNKNGDTLQLAAKNPGLEDTGAILTSGGGKNLDSNNARLLYIRDGLSIQSGSTLNQIDPTGDQFGYIVRVYADQVNIDGNLLVYEQGVNPTNSFLEVREIDPDNNPATDVGDVININSTNGSSIGNLVVDLGNDELRLNSDLVVNRFVYRHGGVNIGTHNLRVDILDLNTESNGDDERLRSFGGEYLFGTNTSGARQYFYTAGNASDGGLSIRVPRVRNLGGADDTQNVGFDPSYDNVNDEYQNPNLLWFPIGVADKYTPAIMWVVDDASVTYSGDEYVTVRPVDAELQTTDLSGGDLLSYYWRIGHEGFDGGLPTVSWIFQYDEDDVVGAESNYIPGKVLDGGTYDRSYDGTTEAVKDAGNSGNGSTNDDTETNNIQGNDPGNIIIFNGLNGGTTLPLPADLAADDIDNGTADEIFQGFNVDNNWNPQFPNTGFTLENANYTAGVAARFIGNPQIFYSRQVSSNYSIGGAPQWSNGNTWSLVSHTGAAAGDWPQDGDIAIIGEGGSGGGAGGPRHHVSYRATDNYQLARIEINNGPIPSWDPRLFIEEGATIDMGVLDGNGTLEVRVDPGSPSNITGDLGLFSSNGVDGARILYHCEGGGTGVNAVELPTFSPEFPNVRIEGGVTGGTYREVYFSSDVTINNELRVDFQAIFRPRFDVLVLEDLRLGNYLEGILEFPGDSEITVEVEGRLRLLSDNNSEVRVENNTAAPALEHRLIVHGNIVLGQGDRFDLYNGLGANDDNVILEVTGNSNSVLSNDDNMPVELYRLIVNKGSSIGTTFTIEDNLDTQEPVFGGTTSGTYQPLEIINGLLIINDPGVDWTIADGSSFLLPNLNNPQASSGSGGIEIGAGTLTIQGDDTGILLDGLLRVSGGTLDMATGTSNGNNFIEYSSSGNAQLQVTAGTADIGSQVRRNLTSLTGILHYSQTGGVVRIGVEAAPETTRGVLEIINSGSSFTHTGGDLTIVRQNGSTTTGSLILQPDAGDFNTTGSTIIMGNADTPGGQNRIGIDATIPLDNVVVGGINSPTVRIFNNALTVNNLTVNLNGTFNADGRNLTVGNTLNNDGTFIVSGNTTNSQRTFFSSASAQMITGSGSTTFWNFTKSGAGTITVDKNITILNEADFLGGIVATGGNTVEVDGDMVHNITHQSDVNGPGIVFGGSSRQNLTRSGNGVSYFGTITINNANGVEINQPGRDFQIDHKVILQTGVFNIGSNLLIMDGDAIFENGSGGTSRASFSVNNMISVNTSLVDKGVRKIYNDGFSGTYLYPVGLQYYTPAEVVATNISGTTPNTGFITIKPIEDFSSGIDNDSDETCLFGNDWDDRQNVLQYFWLVKSLNVTDFDGRFLFYHEDALESVNNPDGFTLANYAPARLLNSDNTWDKNYSIDQFDEVNNVSIFSQAVSTDYSNLSSEFIEGRYTAGITKSNSDALLCGSAIPDIVPLFETLSTNISGNVDVGASFVGGVAPALGQSPDLSINGDFTLVLNDDFRRFRRVSIAAGATLTVDATFGHNLGTVVGDGTLRLVNSAAFPAGDFDSFFPDVSCSTGGGLEYEVTSGNDVTVLGSGLTRVARVIVSGDGMKRLANGVDVDICENFEIRDAGEFEMSDNSALRIKRNIIKESTAVFDGNFANTRIDLDGSVQQQIDGNFTGIQSIATLEVNNSAGLTIINAGNDDVEISDEIIFSNGLIITDANNSLIVGLNGDLTGFNSSRYVNGPLTRILASSTASDYDVFPVGDGARYGFMEINDITISSPNNWVVEYFDQPSANVGSETSVEAPVERASGNEYWSITSVTPSSSNVRLHWDSDSDVQSTISNLRVVYWDGSGSIWRILDDLPAGPTGSPTSGSLLAGTLSYSTQFVTFGTINTTATPLPVELVSFTGRLNDDVVTLKWVTATEVNNSHFEVQRSGNGQDFETIGQVDGRGTTTELSSYIFDDFSPLGGVNYYRLKQVDFDGEYEYSHVIRVDNLLGDDVFDIVVYPNPTRSENINLTVLTKNNLDPVEVAIVDATGTNYYINQMYPTFNRLDLRLVAGSRLPSGMYFVIIQQGDKRESRKLIIR